MQANYRSYQLGHRISQPFHHACSSLISSTVQIAGASVDVDHHLSKPPTFKRKVEIIGGSLTGGQYATYETISSWAFLYAQGLGNVEFGITVGCLRG